MTFFGSSIQSFLSPYHPAPNVKSTKRPCKNCLRLADGGLCRTVAPAKAVRRELCLKLSKFGCAGLRGLGPVYTCSMHVGKILPFSKGCRAFIVSLLSLLLEVKFPKMN